MQPKTALKVSVSESSRHHDKFFPVPNYVIPETRSRDDSNSRKVKRKTYRILVDEFQHTQILFIGPLPKPAETPLQEIPRKLMDLDTDVNTDFKENSPYQEGVISETYQRPISHIYKNH